MREIRDPDQQELDPSTNGSAALDAQAVAVPAVPPSARELAEEEAVEGWAGGAGALSTRQLAWRRFRRHRLAMISAGILAVLALAALFAKFITQYNFHSIDSLALYKGPSLKHWFGTDELGRDEFTRVIYGGRISLLVGVTVALSAGTIGAIVGGLAGYYGSWIDNVLMRFTDLFLSMPFLVILIVASRALGNSVWDIVLILSMFFWMGDARIVRGVFLSLKEKEFVEAAKASGASNKRIIFYHILPNVTGPIVVNLTLLVAAAILTESALSFLGFGIVPPTPSWGNLLSGAQNAIFTAPWLIYFPGLFILLTVLCVNFLGDGLRDALDPHGKISEAV
jgi:peptide/nickel transport system permease protein